MNLDEMRERFDKGIALILKNKREDNKAFLSRTEYTTRIEEVKKSKMILQTSGTKKSTRDYRMIRKYDVSNINGKETLIKPVINSTGNVLYYVTNEELFDILHSTHWAIGHGGRNRMVSELKNKYCNITKESIMLYLRLCMHCQKKTRNMKKGMVSIPTLHSSCDSQARVDLIDMQSQMYNDFRFIMVYQDHSTKFILLGALKSKCAKEVAFNLLDIYTIFGIPNILHSNNGKKFVNSVLNELNIIWDRVKIVHGGSRYSQSQDSMERTIRDVEEMLTAWMTENESRDWPLGLKFIQFQRNRAFHSEIGRSPYEAMFGCPTKVDLASTGVRNDETTKTNTEDNNKAVIEYLQQDMTDEENSNSEKGSNAEIKLENINTDILEESYMTFEICSSPSPSTNDENNDMHLIFKQEENICHEHKKIREYLEKQTQIEPWMS